MIDPLTDQIAARRANVSTAIVDILRQRIVGNELVPGQRLSETSLAEALGTSRTPVREALQQLEREGLILILPQRGTRVARIRLSAVADAYFVRETLECRCVEIAARQADRAAVDGLEEIIERQRRLQAAGDDRGFFAADEQLHSRLMEIAGRPRIWQVVQHAKAHLDRIRHLAVRDPVNAAGIVDAHARIVAAVAAADPEAAVAAMRAHLSNVFKVIDKVKVDCADYLEEEAPDPAAVPRYR